MPGRMNGLDLAHRLRAERPGLKVILSSGYTAGLLDQTNVLPSDLVFLAKPCGVDLLLRTVRQCLDEMG